MIISHHSDYRINESVLLAKQQQIIENQIFGNRNHTFK